MKVLLDECLPVDFRHHLPGHEVHSVDWAGFKGLKNGLLLDQAETAGYEVILTVDQGVPHHQNFVQRNIAVIVVRPRTNQMDDLLSMVETILSALNHIQVGQIVVAS